MRTPAGTLSPRLYALAPRLAVAHAQVARELLDARQARARARERLERKRWLVAHRELELLRQTAGVRRGQQARRHGRGGERAIERRAAKLDEARRELEAAEAQARALDCWFP